MTTTTKQETLKEIFNDDDMGILTLYKVADGELFDTYDEAVEHCYEQGIIYYHKAMEYLMENDASLRDSLELASEMGLEVDNLSSETLATLLYQQSLLNSIEEV